MTAKPLDYFVVAGFAFVLKRDFGATCGGGGAFIPNLWIEVPDVDVFWGQHLDIRLEVRNPTNAGSRQAPLARLPVTISGSATNSLRDLHVEWGFVGYGDGGGSRPDSHWVGVCGTRDSRWYTPRFSTGSCLQVSREASAPLAAGEVRRIPLTWAVKVAVDARLSPLTSVDC